MLNSKFDSMQSIESGNKGEIVMYQPDETIRLEVRVENETVWLTQQQMAELFEATKQNVSLHINNIFKEDELDRLSVVKDSLTTARDGKRYKTKFYCSHWDRYLGMMTAMTQVPMTTSKRDQKLK